MLGLIWILTACLSDGIPKFFLFEVNFEKNQEMAKKHAQHPKMYTIITCYISIYIIEVGFDINP